MLKHRPSIKLHLKPDTIRLLTTQDLRDVAGAGIDTWTNPETCQVTNCQSCDPSIMSPGCIP